MNTTQILKLAIELIASISMAITGGTWVMLFFLRRKVHKDEIAKRNNPHSGPMHQAG
jgi:hypothetical protein